MRLAVAPGPIARWLFRSHDLPSKFSAIASRMYDRRNRAVKYMFVSPLLRTFCVVSAVLVPNYFTEATRGSYRFENARVSSALALP